MEHISQYLPQLTVIKSGDDQTSGRTLLSDWLPIDAPLPLCVPIDPILAQQHLQEVDEARRRRLEKQFGCMRIPERFRGLSPESLTAKQLIGKREAISQAIAWVRAEAVKPGLLVWGLPGVGKSVLGWWAVPQRGWGLWATWPEFYKAVQDGYRLGDSRDKMKTAKSVPVLFLDDLGDPDRARIATDDQRDILFELVNHRCQTWRAMFITSNLNGSGLMVQFGDRIVSRLLELCEFVEMGGIDLRRKT